jgi:hypothetical protein
LTALYPPPGTDACATLTVKLAELRLPVRVLGQRGPLKVGFTADGLELDGQGAPRISPA